MESYFVFFLFFFLFFCFFYVVNGEGKVLEE